MEANEGIESYELLLAVCREKGVELVVGYKQMRDLLERICRSEMQNESLQMTDRKSTRLNSSHPSSSRMPSSA